MDLIEVGEVWKKVEAVLSRTRRVWAHGSGS
jgi:hypothetical protein